MAGSRAPGYGTHSLRRTKAAQIYRKTGNLRAVQLLLGHTKIESTVRYLGIEACVQDKSYERPERADSGHSLLGRKGAVTLKDRTFRGVATQDSLWPLLDSLP